MAQVFLLLVALGWAIMVFGLWQVGVMLAGWRSAEAVVTKSGYSETDQWQDRWVRGNSWFLPGDWSWLDGEDTRRITDEVVYSPADGRQRHALITRRVMRAWFWGPSDAYVVWYDESDPDRVTPRGPLHWLIVALAGVALLGMAIHSLMGAGGLAVAIAQLTGHH